VLTLNKAVRALRAGRSHLMEVLLRDGTWAFLALFGTFVLNGVCYVAIAGARSAVLYAWLYAVSAIVAGRLVLNPYGPRVEDDVLGEVTAVERAPPGKRDLALSSCATATMTGVDGPAATCNGAVTLVAAEDPELGLPKCAAVPDAHAWVRPVSWASSAESDGSLRFATPPPPPKRPARPASVASSCDSALGEYEAYEPQRTHVAAAADVFGPGRMW
jgi:hypothetical protein